MDIDLHQPNLSGMGCSLAIVKLNQGSNSSFTPCFTELFKYNVHHKQQQVFK